VRQLLPIWASSSRPVIDKRDQAARICEAHHEIADGWPQGLNVLCLLKTDIPLLKCEPILLDGIHLGSLEPGGQDVRQGLHCRSGAPSPFEPGRDTVTENLPT